MGREPNLRHWFLEEELELCPDCGEKQLVPPSPVATMRLCLGCGVVPKPIGPSKAAEPTKHAAP